MRYKISKNLILQDLDGKLVGFDTDQSYLYTFNETAEFIFKKIKSGWAEKKIVSALSKKYSIGISVISNDLQNVVKDMVKNKILYSTLSK